VEYVARYAGAAVGGGGVGMVRKIEKTPRSFGYPDRVALRMTAFELFLEAGPLSKLRMHKIQRKQFARRCSTATLGCVGRGIFMCVEKYWNRSFENLTKSTSHSQEWLCYFQVYRVAGGWHDFFIQMRREGGPSHPISRTIFGEEP